MKKALKRISSELYYYENDKKIIVDPTDKSTFPPNVRGALTGVTGNLTGVSGDLSGVRGNLDDCEITPEERAQGVKVEDLIINL